MSSEHEFTYCPPPFQVDADGVNFLAAVRYEEAENGVTGAARLLVLKRLRGGTLEYQHDTAGVFPLSGLAQLLLNIGLSAGACWILPAPEEQHAAVAAALQAEALELIQACELGELPFTAHELSAGKHATELAGLVLQRRGGGAPLCMYFSWVGRTWPVGELQSQSMRDLWEWLEGVNMAATALNCQIRFSPSYMGITMLRQAVHDMERRKRAPLPHASPIIRQLVTSYPAHYLAWRASLRERLAWHAADPEIRPHGGAIPVYIYDRNWSFVSSTRELPVGEPRETVAYVPSRPGLYKLLFAGPLDPSQAVPCGPIWTPFDRHGGPSWPGNRDGVHDVWAWEPELRLARELGWSVVIEHGYYWPEQVDMRPWHNRMWEARRMARDLTRILYSAFPDQVYSAGHVAEAIIKRAGVSGIGRLNQRQGRAVMRTERAKESGADILARHVDDEGIWTGYADVATRTGRDDMYWPEAWSTIISNATARVQATMYRYAQADCFLAYVDGLYCLRRHPELEQDSWDKPGGWRLAATVWIREDDLDELDHLSPYALAVRLATRETRIGAGLDIDGDEAVSE